MTQAPRPFTFPAGMDEATATALLGQAYARVNAGRVVRRTTKRARAEGLDPPFDVAYVAEPAVARFEDGLGVDLGADILAYDAFTGLERCLRIFEEEVGQALTARLEKAVRRWRGPKV